MALITLKKTTDCILLITVGFYISIILNFPFFIAQLKILNTAMADELIFLLI